MRSVILASASPRRKALLEQIGIKFAAQASNFVERIPSSAEPRGLSQRIALEKARIVAVMHQDALVIAADTFIVLDNRIIGKPHTEEEAHETLNALSGRAHSVITGFSIIDTADGKVLTKSVETRVYIRNLAQNEIDAYIASGEPMGKAGSYAIQGLGATIVERIEGDYFNVVGLPLSALVEALKEFGIHILSD
jgi:septum formation protein